MDPVVKKDGAVKEIEFLVSLILLLLGFNLGYYEAGKGMNLSELKRMGRTLRKKVRK